MAPASRRVEGIAVTAGLEATAAMFIAFAGQLPTERTWLAADCNTRRRRRSARAVAVLLVATKPQVVAVQLAVARLIVLPNWSGRAFLKVGLAGLAAGPVGVPGVGA